MISQNTFDIASRLFNIALEEKEKNFMEFLLEPYRHSKCLKQGEYLSNCLTHAAGNGDLDIVKLLLKHGANPNYNDGDALDAAIVNGEIVVANYLVNEMAKESKTDLQDTFDRAVSDGNIDMVKLLLDENNGDNNLVNEKHFSVAEGDQPMTELLADYMGYVTPDEYLQSNKFESSEEHFQGHIGLPPEEQIVYIVECVSIDYLYSSSGLSGQKIATIAHIADSKQDALDWCNANMNFGGSPGDLEWYPWYFECYSMVVGDPDGEIYPEFEIKSDRRNKR